MDRAIAPACQAMFVRPGLLNLDALAECGDARAVDHVGANTIAAMSMHENALIEVLQELRELLAAPPLTYLEARAGWTEADQKYPVRMFCEVCGYWGRVKCMKCGTRVCALECLEAHREECMTRYGV